MEDSACGEGLTSRLDLESRASYLSGLAKGLDLPSGSASGPDVSRVLGETVNLLCEVVHEVVRVGRGDRAEGEAGYPPPRRGSGAESDVDRPVFLACECPSCGEEIFLEIAPDAGSDHSSRTRSFSVACPSCGERISLRQTTGAEWQPREPGAGRQHPPA